MKKSFARFTTFVLVLFAVLSLHAQSISLDEASAKKNYPAKITVTPKDGSVSITKAQIVLTPKKQGTEYVISGYFNGQIVNRTKNTVIRLKNAYIENTNGEAAVLGEAKTEISTAKGTVNYIVSSGKSDAKNGAVQSKKNIELGGSGTLYVLGNVYHGIKGDEVKVKGSGSLFARGTQKGSAVNCKDFAAGEGKNVTCTFFDSKNAIKADSTISILSGTYCLYGNKTALKTDTSDDNSGEAHGITLKNAVFRTKGNGAFYETEPNGYSERSVKFIEE